MSIKESQEKIAANMRDWQKIEKAGIASTGKIIEQSENPIVILIMEIIQRDSQMHYRVQQLIADSLETRTIALTPDELATVWGMIESHIALEKETVEIAEASLAALKGKKMVVQEYLLDYMLRDENKHIAILGTLETIKKGMYPYG